MNTFHYITAVVFNRTRIFQSAIICNLLIEVLLEIKTIHPFKLVGYVLMPDHMHLLINPRNPELSVILRKLKGKSARRIIDWLKANNYRSSLEKLRLNTVEQEFAVWQKGSFVVDLVSPKFLRQKLGYMHMNPVRAGLCDAPQDWRFSSYSAYYPAGVDLPIEVEKHPFWNEVEQ
ncbi:MAG: transposase [Pyrinomonadaceae bacterium]